MNALEFSDAAGWESWLTVQHEQQTEVWLRIGKRHAGIPLVTIAEAGALALCFGWIDGQRKACDEVSFLQRYSRRRPGSSWSKVNVARAELLIKAGRMRPPGLKEIEEAKTDGRWEAAYESQRTARVPAELTAALEGNPSALAAFERLSRSGQYTLFLPLLKAYTPEARTNTLTRIMTRLTTQI
ncbi:YdeI family protein [Arthrobacter sp. GMC3]|uniref:YdeI/OmpD-associated family protein n=1 Tax=Arthrobacter sp. GMC3 TaxID=2058894 RepID=UPI000CE49474|nr:YdeI/OmpD-associated family protein [Arthrobacter sp. GMC3]